MKVTKKTRLLAKPKPRVKIGDVEANYIEGRGAEIYLFDLENKEAIKGFNPDYYQFDCKVSINGDRERLYYCLTSDWNDGLITFDRGVTSGDVVVITLEVDPAKTEFDPTPAVASVVIP